MEKKYRMPVLLSPKFGCSSLERPILKKHVLTGKEFELYSGGCQPVEKANSGPKANSDVSTWLSRVFKGI